MKTLKKIYSSITFFISVCVYFTASTLNKLAFSDNKDDKGLMDVGAIKDAFNIEEISSGGDVDDDGVTKLGKDGEKQDDTKDKDDKSKAGVDDKSKDNKDSKDKDKKDEKKDEDKDKPYQVGSKGYTKDEIMPLVEKEFDDVDFKLLPDDKKEKYIQRFIDIEFGRNRDDWMKSQGKKDQDIADEKKKLIEVHEELDKRAEKINKRENELDTILAKKADTLDTEDDRMNLKLDQRDAQKEKEDIAIDKAKLVHDVKINYFQEQVIELSEKHPELAMSGDYINIMKEHKDGKRKDDDVDVKKGFLLLDIINRAILSDNNPADYYKQNKFSYEHLEFLKSTSKDDTNKSELDKSLDKKKQQQKDDPPKDTTDSQADGKGKDTDTKGDIVKGSSREEKLKNLMA